MIGATATTRIALTALLLMLVGCASVPQERYRYQAEAGYGDYYHESRPPSSTWLGVGVGFYDPFWSLGFHYGWPYHYGYPYGYGHYGWAYTGWYRPWWGYHWNAHSPWHWHWHQTRPHGPARPLHRPHPHGPVVANPRDSRQLASAGANRPVRAGGQRWLRPDLRTVVVPESRATMPSRSYATEAIRSRGVGAPAADDGAATLRHPAPVVGPHAAPTATGAAPALVVPVRTTRQPSAFGAPSRSAAPVRAAPMTPSRGHAGGSRSSPSGRPAASGRAPASSSRR